MKITKEQKKILDNFTCERLSTNKSNMHLMSKFVSKKGESLVDYFIKYAPSEDSNGKTAYYIIKNERKEIFMFFSMKCGNLFEPLQKENSQIQQRLITLRQAIKNANGTEAEINNIISKFSKDLEYLQKYRYKLRDREKEENKHIFRVSNTYSGIELVHFCVNDNMKKKWEKYNLGHPMGEVLFWQFIAPKFFEVQKIVGCEYAFLFAADLSEDSTLVNYYDVTLNFKKPLDVGTSKPSYDFCCEFMCQKINDMKQNQKIFFKNFNLNVDDEIV